MLIEYELQGSQLLHKGLFDTHGFWVKFDVDRCDVSHEITTYKIFSHFSFTFEHKEERMARIVFNGLISAISGIDFKHPDVGFIQEIC